MKSSEFRKVYASLTEPTEVTVNGHVIGTWTPGRSQRAITEIGTAPRGLDHPFNSRPFRPVPKAE